MSARLALASLPLMLLGAASPPVVERPGASKDIAAACAGHDGWSDLAPPAHIHGRTWYVGTCGITVVLVETDAGLVLIDSGPEDAAPQVLANIRALGFDPRKVRLILSTHEHFDHAGGIAAIQAETGAELAVGPFASGAIATGLPDPDDPQAALLRDHPMKPARVDRILRSGGSVVLGATEFTAHATPTHSPGSTSWTWQSCEAGRCLTIAYADSISTIGSDDYRFVDHPLRVKAARRGLGTIGSLPCDLMLTPHPGASDLLERLSGKTPLTDPQACAAYAADGLEMLEGRLAKERAGK